MTIPRTTFTSSGRTQQIEQDGTLIDLARQVGLYLPSLCGGRGKCAKCRCHPRGPVTQPTPLEVELLSADELNSGVRLACQARPLGEVEVAIEEEVLEKGGYTEVAVTSEPLVRKAFLDLPVPAPHDDLSDVERQACVDYLNTQRQSNGTVVSSPFDGSNQTHLDERVRGLLWILAQHPSSQVR